MSLRHIAIVDCNNFYVSCQRVFEPKYNNKPVVVLSNNDGCVVARSNEVKALGVPMGIPLFKIKDLVKQHDIQVYSSNYALYADMSNRVMSILRDFSPDQEVYSIDESFLDLTGFKYKDLTAYAQKIRQTVLNGTGLPVCVGIGATKTLAKLANHVAKKNPDLNGVCNFNQMPGQDLDQLLSKIDIGEIWGIGRKLAPKLQAMGLMTVLDLKRADPEIMRRMFSVVMEKTIRELNGIVCIELEEVAPPKQQIISSRSFGSAVTDIEGLSEAVSLFVSRAAEKLRAQASFAGSLYIYIRTSPFNEREPRYSNGITINIPSPTDNTSKLVSIALWGLKRIYQPCYKYAKAGIMLGEIVPASAIQTDLFSNMQPGSKSEKLMNAMDQVNRKWGRGSIRVASEGVNKAWEMKQGRKSPSYTTNWDELLQVD